MAFTKYASLEHAQVLELRSSPSRMRHASLGKMADFRQYRTEDGYLYARIRAISSRVNKNYDGWPSIELAGGQYIFDTHTSGTGFTVTADGATEYGFSTFLAKPIFIDHHNSDPSRARGAIVDTKLHVEAHKTSSPDDDPEHLPNTWVELLLEVDAKSFPKFAKAIVEGSRNPKKGIDGWSMGCDVEKSVCSICKNAASAPDDYCQHVRMKGAYFDYTDPRTGRKTSKRAYENCYGVKFFEISGVFDPADETALSREVRSKLDEDKALKDADPSKEPLKDLADDLNEELLEESGKEALKRKKGSLPCPNCAGSSPSCPMCRGLGHLSSTRTAEAPVPQSEMSHAPEHVDTLREEEICPVCGSSMDEDTCAVCGYEEPPDGFGNPDLTKAQDVDIPQEPEQGMELGQQPNEIDHQPPPADQGAVNTPTNPTALAHVSSDMAWDVHTNKTSARINKIEQPTVSTNKPQTDEPVEKILSDQLLPVTSRVRTAQDFIAAAGATRGNPMNHTADGTSAEAVSAPDVKTDVIGVGGVDQASNEAASKADAQVDVTGIGGVGVTDVAADQEGVNVEQGDEHSKNIESIPTKTWHGDQGDSLGQQDPVTSEPYPASVDGVHASSWVVESYDDAAFPGDEIEGGSAVKGVQPIAESFGERVDVLDHVTSPSNNSGPTKTWTGTEGNGVNKQQDPVTNESIALGQSGMTDGPNWTASTHIFAAFKLADLEVELGLTPSDRRYERAAELERETPTVVAASLQYAQRVKKSGVRKTAGVSKLPVMGRSAAVEETPSTDDASFMFGAIE